MEQYEDYIFLSYSIGDTNGIRIYSVNWILEVELLDDTA